MFKKQNPPTPISYFRPGVFVLFHLLMSSKCIRPILKGNGESLSKLVPCGEVTAVSVQAEKLQSIMCGACGVFPTGKQG